MTDTPLRIEPQLGTYYFRFNVTRPPMDDVRVRRALSMAIDREAIVAKISRGGQVPAGSFSPPGAGGFAPSSKVGYDPEAARSLMAEAGYPGGEGFPGAEFLYNTSERHGLIAEAVQQMWKRELGIDVSLYNQEWKVYLDSLSNLDYGLARSGWVAVYNDANQFLEIMRTGNPNNRTGWGSAEFDRLHEASMRESDPAERMKLLQQMDAILVEESPVAPVYHYTQIYLKDARVENWAPGPLDKRRYKYVRLRAE
jgi:oligopeptide transport system substrate-binding protein